MNSDDTPHAPLSAPGPPALEYTNKPAAPDTLVQRVRSVLDGAPPPIQVVSATPDWVELVAPCTRAAVESVQEVVAHLEADLSDDVRESVGYAFRELLLNAVEWGGKFDPERHVRMSFLRGRRMLLYRIADPGSGFCMEDLAHAAIAYPGNPLQHMAKREEKGLRPGGFGLALVRAKVDELIYNEKRNEVVFIKYLD